LTHTVAIEVAEFVNGSSERKLRQKRPTLKIASWLQMVISLLSLIS